MRLLLTILLITISSAAWSQVWQKNTANTKTRGTAVDSIIILPKDTAAKLNPNVAGGETLGDSARLAYKNRTVWVKTDTGWKAVGNPLDTTSLSSRINAKLDTARFNDSIANVLKRRDSTLYVKNMPGSAQTGNLWMTGFLRGGALTVTGGVTANSVFSGNPITAPPANSNTTLTTLGQVKDSLSVMRDSVNKKLDKPSATNNTLNAIVVVDGQNKSYIRSADSLPYIRNQFAGEQSSSELWVDGRIRSKGVISRIQDGSNQASLIDWIRSDASTTRARIGFWNSGVMGPADVFGGINFLGPSWLVAKKDSTLALGTIDGSTVSTKFAIRGRNIIMRKSGMIVNLAGALLDSASGNPVSPSFFLDVDAGGDNTSARFSAGVAMRRINTDSIKTNTGLPIIVPDKFRIVSATGVYPFDIKRDISNQGLSIDAGGGVANYNSYDTTNIVWGRHYFRSTKGTATKISMVIDANTDRVGIGPATSLTSTLQVQGSISFPYVTITANTTLDETHKKIRTNNSANIVVTLPAASSCPGRVYVIKKVSNNAFTVSVTPNGTDPIDGTNAAFVISGYNDSFTFQSYGSGWDID